MNTKHTTGPWLHEGKTVYALMHHGWRRGVEQFKNRFYASIQVDRECSEEEAEANARLIAAAPELLEALEAVRAWDVSNLALDIPLEIRKQMQAAIAKATGEQP